MFTLVDRETGRMLALRPDITPQIAHVVATRLRDEPKPIRLAYVTNVFRYDEPRVSHYREFYQAGVELVGLDKPEAEAEIIAMAIEGLRALGLERFQIDLGHPDFVRGLLDEAKTDPASGRELRAALARKDGSTLERLVADLAPPAHVRDALLALPTLFGRESVLSAPPGSRGTSGRRKPLPTSPRRIGCSRSTGSPRACCSTWGKSADSTITRARTSRPTSRGSAPRSRAAAATTTCSGVSGTIVRPSGSRSTSAARCPSWRPRASR